MRVHTAVIILVTALLPQAAFAGENLLENPGFELVDEETGFATAWEEVFWSNPHGTIELSEEARSGERSAMLRGLPPEQITDPGKRNNHLVAQTLEGLSGVRRLVLSAWYRAEPEAGAYLSIMTHDAEGNRLQYISSTRSSNRLDWTQMTLTFTTEPQTERVTVYLRNGGEGAVWFDDASLTSTEDVLENDLARAMVETLVGGRLRSFQVGEDAAEWTTWQGVRPGGMVAEIVPGDEYPGLLRDAPWQAEVLEPNRRLLLHHRASHPDLAGLVFEKELALPEGSAALEVTLRVRNEADAARSLNLRAQQCLPRTGGLVTWRSEDALHVYRHPEDVLKRSVSIEDLARGWIAHADPDADAGTVFLFDREAIEKGLLYVGQDLQTVEWYYRQTELAPNETWETTYRIAPIRSGTPVVAVADDVAAGLSPLRMAAEEDYILTLAALADGWEGMATASGFAAEGTRPARVTPAELAGLAAVAVELPWGGMGIERIDLSVAGEHRASLSEATIEEVAVTELPEPPAQLPAFPAATQYFPYGEYLRGLEVPEAGTKEENIQRNLRAYRRAYINTYIVGEGHLLGPFKQEGRAWICELLREFDMRAFPKGEFLRVFERTEDGRREEIFPGIMSRDEAVARIEEGGYDLQLRRHFAEQYGDVILAYDVSDEPSGQHIPNYLMVQSIFREIDPRHPALTILNLSRTEYLPYMPIYYGDEYPIRNEARGGRRPWAVWDAVRFCAEHTSGPVWVMLQAFGGLADYTWQLPSEAEMRLTIYSVIGAGGKGITFHGSFSPPCWRYNHHYFYTSRDSWGVAEPAWRAMRECGRHLTAIGPALLDTRPADAEAFTLRCAQLEAGGGAYAGPAVRLGILRERMGEGRFLVVVNQDVANRQQAELLPNAQLIGEGEVLIDLHGLAEIGPVRELEHPLELAPGDGRIFYCGPPEAAQQVLGEVHRHHCDNERAIFRIDLEMARANGVKAARAADLAAQSEQALDAGDAAAAHRLILQAQEALADAIQADDVLSDAIQALDESLELLASIARTYREHFDVVVPPEDRAGAPKYRPWTNTQDAWMQQYVDETAAAFCDMLNLETRVYAGEAADALPEIRRVRQEAERLNDEAIAYVTSQAEEAEQ
ncbi:MAG: hypothetical protein U9R79_20730 [Armatimonadota bacterium]|nr:hypothetical protein [Armatimonadota bacterium]